MLDTMAAQAIKAGRELPKLVTEAPTLPELLVPYYMAFEELSFGRHRNPNTGVPTGIPWVWIDQYCRRNRHLDFEDALLYIRKLDMTFIRLEDEEMEFHRKKNQQQAESHTKGSKVAR